MSLMRNTKAVMLLHGSLEVWRQLRRSNQCWRHTFLNDNSLYTVLIKSLLDDLAVGY